MAAAYLKRQGLTLGPSFSPGCQSVPLAVQPLVLELAGGSDIGISINAANMLIPVKSCTAIIPAGPGLKGPAENDSCETCERRGNRAYCRDGILMCAK